jgi:hypothetical protein
LRKATASFACSEVNRFTDRNEYAAQHRCWAALEGKERGGH